MPSIFIYLTLLRLSFIPFIDLHTGVFGSGKSYLLAIVILFLVQIFETSEATDIKRPAPWKVLISSSTNVAVDRVLLW